MSRHEFYETDERLTLSIFDKGADPEKVQISFEPRKVNLARIHPGGRAPTDLRFQFTYTHGDKTLVLEPLKGQIKPDESNYTVGKVKVEIRFAKAAIGRWGGLTGDAPDSTYLPQL